MKYVSADLLKESSLGTDKNKILDATSIVVSKKKTTGSGKKSEKNIKKGDDTSGNHSNHPIQTEPAIFGGG
jgi:hypothetical protein